MLAFIAGTKTPHKAQKVPAIATDGNVAGAGAASRHFIFHHTPNTHMEIINLTPHDFSLCNEAGEVVRVIPPTKPAARVSSASQAIGSIDGIPVTKTTFGHVEGLPDPQEGVCYIVSLLVQQRVPHRSDVYRPDTGPASVVRDAAGQIIGVKALAAFDS